MVIIIIVVINIIIIIIIITIIIKISKFFFNAIGHLPYIRDYIKLQNWEE